MKVQYILNDRGERIFAVIPYSDYIEAFRPNAKEITPHISDVTSIALPYGGGHSVDVVQLAGLFYRKSTTAIATPTKDQVAQHALGIPIDARREPLEQVLQRRYHDGIPGLDALIRSQFLPADSAYRGTVQAVRDVVDALVHTGLFRRCRLPFPGFYRPVNALEFDDVAGYHYLRKHKAIDKSGQWLLPTKIGEDYWS